MHIARHCRKPRAEVALGLLIALVLLVSLPGPAHAVEVDDDPEMRPAGTTAISTTTTAKAPTVVQHLINAVEWTFHKTADGAHPNDLEQQILWLMNRARANPSAEALWLTTTHEPDVARAREYFKIDIGLLSREFLSYQPKPPAAFDVRLYQAAVAHSENLIARDAQNHDGQYDRVLEAGFQCGGGPGYYFRGNVFSYSENGLNTHAAWNIDWGGPDGGMQTDRGHRMGVMSVDGNLTNAGFAVLYEGVAETLVGPFVVTGNYCHAATAANHYNRFLVGTVWQDRDADQMYDPGEGIGGVKVEPDESGYYAVTARSGGYAIPITRPGRYKVAFRGTVNGVREVVVKDESVLLDYVDRPVFGKATVRTSLIERGPSIAGGIR
jgi:hypothetical protein